MTLFSSLLVALAGIAASANSQTDWANYYKGQGAQINRAPLVQTSPVFVSPQINWAVPNTVLPGTPNGPAFPPPHLFPNYPGYPKGSGYDYR